jgi:hypothetical protein
MKVKYVFSRHSTHSEEKNPAYLVKEKQIKV